MPDNKCIYIKLTDIEEFPIRLNHHDKENGNIHFILGIETVMEYIDYLPRYEFPEAEPMDRSDEEYYSYVESPKEEQDDTD